MSINSKQKRRVAIKILFTDERCVINGRPQPGIPLMLDGQNKVIVLASDWLRHLAVDRNRPITTLHQYSHVVRAFSEELLSHGLEFEDVDINFLTTWRNKQEVELKIKKGTINYRLGIITSMLWWGEKTGRIEGVIGETRWEDGPLKFQIPVSIVPVKRGTKTTSKVVVTGLRYSTTREASVHTPTEIEIERIHAALCSDHHEDLSTRNTLMASWADEAGRGYQDNCVSELTPPSIGRRPS